MSDDIRQELERMRRAVESLARSVSRIESDVADARAQRLAGQGRDDALDEHDFDASTVEELFSPEPGERLVVARSLCCGISCGALVSTREDARAFVARISRENPSHDWRGYELDALAPLVEKRLARLGLSPSFVLDERQTSGAARALPGLGAGSLEFLDELARNLGEETGS